MAHEQRGVAEKTTEQTISNLQMQALLGEMRRMLKLELEPIQERLDRVEVRTPQELPRDIPSRRLGRRGSWEDDELEEEAEYQGRFGRQIKFREAWSREDNNLGSIKMKIPSFQGRSDPEAYLEWEKKMEFIFDCHNYSETKKVKLAVIEFSDYAITWWDQLVLSRRRNREHPVETWEEMKAVMRKRFVPSYYYRELHKRLQGLRQGNRSVEDYYKEMEIVMIRANVEEDREATMARFLFGLNREIHDRVEMHHYVELEDMVHMAIKVEQQLKRGSGTRAAPNPRNIPWKSNSSNREVKPETSTSQRPKFEPKSRTASRWWAPLPSEFVSFPFSAVAAFCTTLL